MTWFQKALELEPDFLQAKAYLADQYGRKGYSSSDPEAQKTALLLAEQVLERDPNQMDALTAKARVLWTRENGWHHLEVYSLSQRVLVQNPRHSTALFLQSIVLWHLGFMDEAEVSARQFKELNPDNGTNLMPFFFFDTGRVREAVQEAKAQPNGMDGYTFPLFLGHAERLEEAWTLAQAMERHGPGGNTAILQKPFYLHSVLSVLAAERGDRATALRYAAAAKAEGEQESVFHHGMFNLACAHALLGMKAEAMYWLKRCTREGYPCLSAFETNPDLSSLHQDPEFTALLAELKEKQRGWRRNLGLPVR
jgi:tetratricopeptide (TPR) repeat protein